MTTLSSNSTLLNGSTLQEKGCAIARPITAQAAVNWGLVGLLVATCIFATFDAWQDLVAIGWADEESSHILLAPLTFAWIFWSRRHQLKDLPVRRRWVGIAVMGLAWGMWSFGYRTRIHTAWHLGAVLLAVGGVITVTGLDFVRRFLPAFAALIFLIPMANERRQQLAAPMQLITAKVTQNVCEIFGMVVERRGSLLSSNGVDVAIAEACNGMRMVLTLIIVSYLYAFITPLRGYVRAILIILSPLTAVVCNVIRLVPTVWMFAHTSRSTAETFHDYSGWFMLLVGFGLLMGTISLLRWTMLPVDAIPAKPVEGGAQ